jgi:hypothetical protein
MNWRNFGKNEKQFVDTYMRGYKLAGSMEVGIGRDSRRE